MRCARFGCNKISPAGAFAGVAILSLLHMATPLTQSSAAYMSRKGSLPPALRSNIPGSWAYDTMSRRILSDILPRVLQDVEHDSSEHSHLREGILRLQQLGREIQQGQTTSLTPILDSGPDVEMWNRLVGNLEPNNWLDSEWLITEFYFYRRIAEAVGFFETSYDPFKRQKRSGLDSARTAIDSLGRRIMSLDFASKDLNAGSSMVKLALQMALWGNRLDLSLWPAGSEGNAASLGNILSSGEEFLLCDQSNEVVEHLFSEEVTSSATRELGVVVDNAGFELVTDMFMADVLLRQGVVDKVILHTKGHPTFVSDATTEDVLETIEALSTLEPSSEAFAGARHLGQRWKEYIDTGRFVLKDNLYWAQPWPMWEMPQDVTLELSQHALCVVKGDANYRRLLGERDWPFDTPFQNIVDFFPCSVCALRSLKSEIASGIPDKQAHRAMLADPQWLVNGRWGVIQYSERSPYSFLVVP